MNRLASLLLSTTIISTVTAQQMTLDWAAPVVAQNQRVKLANNGDLFAFGTAEDAVHLQRLSPTGAPLWTKILEAPDLRAIDMDVDAQDNIYIYMGFSTGQLDLDPGPNQSLVDPGKVYAKYNATGTFQWGFVLENLTDMSEDFGALSVDDAGNLYICGDLGAGVYDFDPGVDEYPLEVEASTGCYMARYQTDGTLEWAHLWTWPSGSCNARDIAVMRDGASFDLICELDNGGALSSQIDVDLGVGVYNVFNGGQHLLRYTNNLEFLGRGSLNYYQARLTNDAEGNAYILGYRLGGIGPVAAKFNLDGTTLEELYETQLYTTGNLRLGDVEADEQGGCLGMYNNNCDASAVRFYKMDVSGLVDFNNLYLSSGTDCTMPGAKGFALDGNTFYIGTYNNNYQIDFDPDGDVLNLPSGENDGVIAKYSWCAGVPFDPFEISTPTALCVGTEATFTASAFGDAESYVWTVPIGWTITGGQGTESITVEAIAAGSGNIAVAAVNDCGNSAAVGLTFTFFTPPIVDAGPDVLICSGASILLNASSSAFIYSWMPGGETTQTIAVSPTETTTYAVEVTDTGCSASDLVVVMVDPCLGVTELNSLGAHLWPVPVKHGDHLRVEGVDAKDLLGIVGSDGRAWPLRIRTLEGVVLLNVDALPPGIFVLHNSGGTALRFVVVE